MKSLSIALFFFLAESGIAIFASAISTQPLQLPQELEFSTADCLNKANYIVHRRILKERVMNCCKELLRHRESCLPDQLAQIPKVQSKWDLAKKLTGKPLQWHIPHIEEDRRRKVIRTNRRRLQQPI